MKKSILIITAACISVSLMAFGYLKTEKTPTLCRQNSNEAKIIPIYIPSDVSFFFDIDSRFSSTLTKKQLHNAISVLDLLPKDQSKEIESFKSVKVTILNDYHLTDKTATGNSDMLTPDQLTLLQTVNYSNNIHISAEFQRNNSATGGTCLNHITPHITIVPEKEAEFLNGKEALIDYLKTNSKKETAHVEASKLQAGKIYFTVTKDGGITNPKLASSSGYKTVDEKMLKLMTTIPGEWLPAENENGEKVEQKLVFSFGTIAC